jgi:hypothetical protein
MYSIIDHLIWLVVYPPLWKKYESWDGYSQYMEKYVPNHQSAIMITELYKIIIEAKNIYIYLIILGWIKSIVP